MNVDEVEKAHNKLWAVKDKIKLKVISKVRLDFDGYHIWQLKITMINRIGYDKHKDFIRSSEVREFLAKVGG